MPVVLPYVFGNLSGAVPASDLDANFNALAAAIDAGIDPTAGSGININSGGTISFNPNGVAIDTATVGSHQLSTAFLSLFNTGTTIQTVQGTVDFSGFVQTTLGVSFSKNATWSGAANYNNSNPTQAGVSGYQSFSGSITGSGTGGTYLNALTILDYMDTHTIGGSIGFGIQHNMEGTGGASGFRTAAAFTLNVNGPTGNTGGEYVGLTSYAQGSGPDNGTTLAASGVLWGLNTVSHLTSTCTHWQGNVGYELDIETDSGASVVAQYGLHVCTLSSHAVSGSSDDIAMHVSGSSGQTAFWKVGLGFGAVLKPTAFNSSSTLIKVYPDVSSGTLTIANFIDMTPSSVTVSGNLLIAQGTTISGTGNASFLSVAKSIGTITAAGSNQATATVITTQDVIVSSGTGGIRLVNFGNGAECIIRNRTGATINVYPQTGAQIETAGTNVAVTLANGSDGRYSPSSTTQWYF